jgi:methionine-S-sulfoxide reductase
VIHTRVGYAGGTTKSPTYHNIGDHSETTQIDFDPDVISYAKLLDLYWSTHSPCGAGYSRQYMSIIFYHNDEQKKLALETKTREEKKRGAAVPTEVVAYKEFTQAEDYHQKYSLRNSHIMKEMKALFPKDADFVNSTAAARINGYLAGYGKLNALKEELKKLDLSEETIKKLLDGVRER